MMSAKKNKKQGVEFKETLYSSEFRINLIFEYLLLFCLYFAIFFKEQKQENLNKFFTSRLLGLSNNELKKQTRNRGGGNLSN